VGLYGLLRYYRYAPGQSFAPHVDHTVYSEDLDGTESRYTVLTYLCGGCEGGETKFPEVSFAPSAIASPAVRPAPLPDTGILVAPTAGAVLAFRHDNLHEGCRLESGRKYIGTPNERSPARGLGPPSTTIDTRRSSVCLRSENRCHVQITTPATNMRIAHTKQIGHDWPL